MKEVEKLEVDCVKDAHEAVSRLGYPIFISPVDSTHPDEEVIEVVLDECDDFSSKIRKMLRMSAKGMVLISKE
jgi:GTP:adenosylcobinamide-phosphate guanylyltransferase